MARGPVRPQVSDSQKGFADGLNDVSDPSALLPTQMRRSDNFRLAEYGAVTKRGGTQQITTAVLAAVPVRSGAYWRLNSTTVYGLVSCDGKLKRFTWGSFPRTFTDLGTVVDVAASVVAFRDASANVAYIADGGDLKKYDGTTFSTVAAAVDPTGVCVYHERLWGWGVGGSLDSVFYSALDDGDTLGVGASGGGQIIVRTMGQRNIVACAPVNTSLIIWHQKGISRLTGYGQSDITTTPEAITSDAGLVGQDALCVYDNVAYFVSSRGVFKCNETEVAPLASKEKPDPVAPQLMNLSAANLALVNCKFNRRTKEVWVQLPGIGIYVYHTVLQSWSGPFVDGYISPDTTCLFEMLDSSDQPVMLRGDASGWVSQCEPSNVYLDNVVAAGTGGTVYNAVVQCHRFYGTEDKTQAIGWIWAMVLGALSGSASAAVEWNSLTSAGRLQIQTGTGAVIMWGTGTWGTGTWGAGGQAPFYIRLSGTGPFLDLTIIDSGSAASVYAGVHVTGALYGRR